MPREMIIVAYDPAWKTTYEKAVTELATVFGLDTRFEHFGSTSVEGLWAKPIIDILAIVEDIDKVDDLTEALSGLGYIAKGENGIEGRRYFHKTLPDQPDRHTHHLHVYPKGHPAIDRELAFRDILRDSPEARQAYTEVKQAASIRFRTDPEGYTDAKTEVISIILNRTIFE